MQIKQILQAGNPCEGLAQVLVRKALTNDEARALRCFVRNLRKDGRVVDFYKP